ncbi:efflux RND transporter periplasmic adaptor subunit [Aliidiomarina celeris]|uniref:efflux RND transporter periplasmic adaptor subunit n=1 Tax=Aliidiomarina celeris TaxID=2249428 RepID=UPI001E2BABA2|nr:efflux RND transporter periplasmic adaptor subunit [Aliidiomarina celeris]
MANMSLKPRIFTFAAAIVGLVVIFTLLAGTWVSKVEQQIDPVVPQRAGQTAVVTSFELPEVRFFSGQMEPRQEASMSSRITARVADVLVEAGDRVQQGDVLVRLENDDLSARVRQQQQTLAAAQARVNEARSNFQRVSALVEQGLLPSAALDEAIAQRDTTEAELAGAREGLSEAQTSESFSVITAPFDAVISDRGVYTGDTAAPGMQLIRLYQPESLRFEAWVSESALRFIQPGKVFSVTIDAHEQAYSAVVTEIVPAADAASRSFVVRLSIDMGAQAQPQQVMYPGMYGRLAVRQDTKRERLGVPAGAVETLGQLHFVQVVKAQGLERRLVRLGETSGFVVDGEQWYEVVSGVQKGDTIALR